MLLDYLYHCFSILARKLKGQPNIYQGWGRGVRVWGYSEQSWEGRLSPLPCPQILRNATQSLSREAAGRNPMDLKQPAALSPLEGREAAAEGAERKGEERREREKKLELPIDSLLDS